MLPICNASVSESGKVSCVSESLIVGLSSFSSTEKKYLCCIFVWNFNFKWKINSLIYDSKFRYIFEHDLRKSK